MKINVSEAKHLYEDGWTLVQLAQRYEVAQQNVNKALRRAGCKLRPPRRGSTSPHDSKREAILDLYRRGLSAADAGKRHGASRSCALRFITAAKLPKNSYHLPSTICAPIDPALLAYTAGMLDGEGHIGSRDRGRFRIAIYSTDEEVVRWLAKAWSGGSIRCVERPNGWLPMWQRQLSRTADIELFLQAIVPFMVIKRKRQIAEEIIGKRAAGRLLDGREWNEMPERANG